MPETTEDVRADIHGIAFMMMDVPRVETGTFARPFRFVGVTVMPIAIRIVRVTVMRIVIQIAMPALRVRRPQVGMIEMQLSRLLVMVGRTMHVCRIGHEAESQHEKATRNGKRPTHRPDRTRPANDEARHGSGRGW